MSTLKFKVGSPFLTPSKDTHHASDFKYQQHKDGAYESYTANAGTPVCRIALFGVGRAGSIHLNNLSANQRTEVAYVVEVEGKRQWCNDRWNLAKANVKFITPEESDRVYNDVSVDACIVATSTLTHEEIICSSLKAGKHVFAEKPIGETTASTARCYRLAKECGKVLFCAFNRRFDPSFRAVKDQVSNGVVGHVHLIKTTSRDSPVPSLAYLKTSGGIFHDCAVHDIDLITWILGDLPVEVYSAANAQIPEIGKIEDFDNVVITLKFRSGSLGVIDLSRYASYGYDQRLEVFGPLGMINVENDTPQRTVTSSSQATETVPIYYSFPSRHAIGYQFELDHFVDTVVGRSEPFVTEKMTLAVTKIATAAEEAAKSGLPVKLEWDEKEVPENWQ